MKLRLCRDAEKARECRLFDMAHCCNEAGVTPLEVSGILKTELKRKNYFFGTTQGSILETEVTEHRNRTDECRKDVGDSAQVSDGDGGAMRSEQFSTQVVNPCRAQNSVVVCGNLTSGGWEPGM